MREIRDLSQAQLSSSNNGPIRNPVASRLMGQRGRARQIESGVADDATATAVRRAEEGEVAENAASSQFSLRGTARDERRRGRISRLSGRERESPIVNVGVCES